MSKFRIVELIHGCRDSDRRREFVIEKKYFFGGWKEVMKKEVKSERIPFKTAVDAEKYLFKNYTGHGMCTRYGNVYEYKEYQYYV